MTRVFNGMDVVLETVSRALDDDPLKTWEASGSSLWSSQRNEAGLTALCESYKTKNAGPTHVTCSWSM